MKIQSFNSSDIHFLPTAPTAFCAPSWSFWLPFWARCTCCCFTVQSASAEGLKSQSPVTTAPRFGYIQPPRREGAYFQTTAHSQTTSTCNSGGKSMAEAAEQANQHRFEHAAQRVVRSVHIQTHTHRQSHTKKKKKNTFYFTCV